MTGGLLFVLLGVGAVVAARLADRALEQQHATTVGLPTVKATVVSAAQRRDPADSRPSGRPSVHAHYRYRHPETGAEVLGEGACGRRAVSPGDSLLVALEPHDLARSRPVLVTEEDLSTVATVKTIFQLIGGFLVVVGLVQLVTSFT